MFGVKHRARLLLGRYRRTGIVRRLHAVSTFIDEACQNVSPPFETGGERALLDRLASGAPLTVFDVGANAGDWTRAAAAVWPNAVIHAFEVAPRTVDELRASCATMANVRVVASGLSDTNGSQEFYYFPDHSDLTCDRPRHEGLACEPFTATLSRVDTYAAGAGVTSIDFLKIDVEGREAAVLDGCGALLSGGHVGCVQFEYGAFAISTRVLIADFYARLQDFWIGRIFPNHVEFADYHWTMEDFRFRNYLAVHKSRPDVKRLSAG